MMAGFFSKKEARKNVQSYSKTTKKIIKPIQTIYKGYKFRSRLEARWAVFFDVLEIPKWEYEKEGFDINGKYYLPDFYIEHIDTWIEIKPMTCPSGVFTTYKRVSNMINFIVLGGSPFIDIYSNQINKEIKSGIITHTVKGIYNGMSEENAIKYYGYNKGQWPYIWCECPVCKTIEIHLRGNVGMMDCSCDYKDYRLDEICNTVSPRLVKAYIAARQARFEYGENK